MPHWNRYSIVTGDQQNIYCVGCCTSTAADVHSGSVLREVCTTDWYLEYIPRITSKFIQLFPYSIIYIILKFQENPAVHFTLTNRQTDTDENIAFADLWGGKTCSNTWAVIHVGAFISTHRRSVALLNLHDFALRLRSLRADCDVCCYVTRGRR